MDYNLVEEAIFFYGGKIMKQKTLNTLVIVPKTDKDKNLEKTEYLNADIGSALLSQPDQTIALKLIEEQAGLVYDVKHGGEIKTLELEIEEQEERYQTSNDTRKKLEEKRHHTPRYVVTSIAHRDGIEENSKHTVPFSKWQIKHQATITLAYIFGSIVLLMSATNAFSNLMSSGIPAFLDTPFLAIMLSTLPLAGGITLKFIANLLHNGHTRRFYVLGIYILSGLTLFAWTVLFAMNFHGVSSAIDFDNIGKESGFNGALFVWVTMAAEMLIGATLFIMADSIHARYSPDYYSENLEYLEIKKTLQEHLKTHEALRNDRNAKHARLKELDSEKNAYINIKLVAFMKKYEQFKN